MGSFAPRSQVRLSIKATVSAAERSWAAIIDAVRIAAANPRSVLERLGRAPFHKTAQSAYIMPRTPV